MLKSILAATAVALSLSGAALADSFVIDTEGAHASINFEANHLGYSIVTGRFDKFAGSFEFDAADPAAGSVEITIDTASLNSNHGARDNHLRSPDFFDTSSFPEASFKSTSIEVTGDDTANITGDLTLRGVTKSVVLAATMIGEGDDPWGAYRAGFMGETSFVPADFGMPNGVAKAPIKVIVHVEGIRK